MSGGKLARGLRWALGIVLGLLVLVVVLVWFGLSSEWAARKLLAVAVDRTPSLERVGRVTGALGGPLELRDIIVNTEAMSARVDRVLLDWRPTALLARRLELRRLHVSGVRVLMADSVPEEPDTLPEPRQQIDPPLEIHLGDVRVSRVSVDAPGGLRLRKGSLILGGRARDYALGLSGVVATPAVGEVGLDVGARGNLDGMVVDSATAALLGGVVAAEGPVRWWPEVGWDLVVMGRDLRPASLMPDSAAWPGALSFRAASAGVLDSTGPIATVTLDTLTGTLRGEALGGKLTAQARGEEYRIPGLALRWGSASLDASGAAGRRLDLKFDLSVPRLAALLPGAGGALRAEGAATGPSDSARIAAEFSGRGLRYQGNRLRELTGRADVELAADGRTDVDLRARDAVVAERRVDRLTLTVRGTRGEHRMSAEIDAPDATLRLAAAGGVDQDTVWNGRIGTLDIRSEQAGAWRLASPVRLSAGAVGADLDTLCLRSEDAARLCAAAAWRQTGSWRFASELLDVPLSLAAAFLPEGWALEGSLDGNARAAASESGRLSADVRLVPDGAALAFQTDTVTRRLVIDGARLEVQAGRNGVSGAVEAEVRNESGAPIAAVSARGGLPQFTRLGQAMERQPLEARIESRLVDLAALAPFVDSVEALSGSASLDLTAAGTVRSPRIEGRLRLTDLAARHLAGWAARGSAEGDVDLTVGADRSLAGELRFHPRDVVLELPGDTLPRSITLDTGSVEVRADSAGVAGRLLLALAAASGRPLATAEGTFTLSEYTSVAQDLAAQPIRVRIEGRLPELAALQELAPPSSLTDVAGSADMEFVVEGTVAAPQVTGELHLREARASHARGWSAAATLAATLEGALARDSTISGELRIVPGAIAFEYAGDEGPRRLTVDTGGVVLLAGDEGIRGTLALGISDQGGTAIGTLSGRLGLPGYTRLGQVPERQVLEAEAEGRFDDLSFVEAVTDRVDSLEGRLTLDVTATGTLAEPEVVGGLAFVDGAVSLPAAGIRIREVTFEAKGDQSQVITLTGGMSSGEGRLTVEGTVPVSPTAERPVRVSIRGQDFTAVDLPEARVVITPSLEVTATDQEVETTGEIRIPVSRIELAEIPASAVPVSDDVVFVDSAAAAPPLDVGAEVRVVLGDSVSFKGFNFTADLGGSLLVAQPAGGQPTGSGELVIEEGRYKAYGQDLSISQGRVRFGGGPVDNPGLDIRATRTAEDGVVAGLDIGGTLKEPEVTIFSEPPMAQSEALAYIVLGHPLGEGGSSEDGTLVAQAAQSLGLRGGNLLVRTLGRQVGLDEARLETDGDLEEAAFVAGKYLSPNLYVSYGIGLFDPVSTLRLRYMLSSHWTLQAETGTATGTDLLYHIEVGE